MANGWSFAPTCLARHTYLRLNCGKRRSRFMRFFILCRSREKVRLTEVQISVSMNTSSMILFLAILLVAPAARANVAVPDVIGNAMVLQRDQQFRSGEQRTRAKPSS